MNRPRKILTAQFGIASVSIFVVSFFLFATLNADFNSVSDYISKLGAVGQPNGRLWNLIGFGVVGISLAVFGWLFGICKKDRFLGTFLAVAGIGFAMAAIPTDLDDANSALSKVHFVSVCVSLAGWCFGLSRLTSRVNEDSFSKSSSYAAVAIVALPLVGVGAGLMTEPIAHRLILAVVFAWVIAVSVQLIRSNREPAET